MLWYLDPQGTLAVSPVRTGITDGQYTQVTGPKLEAGMQVIAGISQSTVEATGSPFQSSSSSGGHRRFGF
jgi:multidrug efflux pump subunit AcrA (membrane-fusion protein)